MYYARKVKASMFKKVEVEAPASSANLGAGFDVFAIALNRPKDLLIAERVTSKGITVKMMGLKKGIPESTINNAAGAVAKRMLEEFRLEGGLSISIKKGVPVGLGLGSSGASSAAAAVAINELYNLGLKAEQLIYFASFGELAVAKVAHKDNVAASLLGNFVVLNEEDDIISYINIKVPKSARFCIAVPSLDLPERKTEYSRSILPKEVDIKELKKVASGSSLVVAGFLKNDIEMAGKGMMKSFVDNIRSKMIRGFEDVKDSALKNGAAGVCLSGAGPSILALVDKDKVKPESVLNGMLEAFRNNNVNASGFIAAAGKGARLIYAE